MSFSEAIEKFDEGSADTFLARTPVNEDGIYVDGAAAKMQADFSFSRTRDSDDPSVVLQHVALVLAIEAFSTQSVNKRIRERGLFSRIHRLSSPRSLARNAQLSGNKFFPNPELEILGG